MKLNAEKVAEPTAIEEVALGIVRVPLRTPTLPPATRTNAYLVRGDSGIWVVDPGAPDTAECALLADAMAEAEQRWGLPIVGAILTHHHPDHVGGLGWWVDAVGLPIVADKRTLPLLAGAVPTHALGAIDAVEWIEVDGTSEIDGLSLVFTPGHAPGHLVLWTADGGAQRAARVLIAGDLVSGIGTIVINPPRGNMTDYLDSLAVAARLDPALLLPAHGPETSDPVARLEAYRAHRLAREAKVVDAMIGRRPMSAGQITAIAYDDVPTVLHGFAERSVLAHLEKLLNDGRVTTAGGMFELVD